MDNKIVLAICIISIVFFTMVLILIITITSTNAQKKSLLHIMKLYNDIKESDTRLRAAVNMEKSFIRNLNHEIRTPLNAISGFAQLLCSPDIQIEDKEKTECANYIIDNVQLMTSMLSDMISFSDIENNEIQFTKEPILVNDLLNSAINTVKYRVVSGVSISWNSAVGDEYTIEADKSKVRQIIINMLTNACKNTAKGFIRLDCRLDNEGYIEFSITDSGTGVSEETKKYIFDAFAKGDEFKQGLGLGLTICKMLAEGMNGEIMLDDTYTEGARFAFRIPLNNLSQ